MSGFDILKGLGGGGIDPNKFKIDLPEPKSLVGDPPVRKAGGGESSGGASFVEKLESALGEVRQLQEKSNANYEALGRGEDVELHQVMMDMGKSEVAFNLMLEVRNKLLEAWQQLSRSVN